MIGKVTVMGTPAEEGGAGKVKLINAGVHANQASSAVEEHGSR